MSQTPAPSPSLSSLAIRRHIGTLMLTLTAIVLGLFFLLRLPVDLLPSITYPRIGVRVEAPGLSPEVAVDEITRPLEQALTATQGVEQIFSETREGRVSLNLYFAPGSDIDQALNDATAALNRARSRLPDTIDSPRLFKFDPSQLPVYEFALTSPSLQGNGLRVFAEEELARELSVMPGVASVDVSGGAVEEVQINLDFQRMQALGIGVSDVLTALGDRNQDVSGGRLKRSPGEPLTRTLGKFETAADLENLGLAGPSRPTESTQRIYVRDVAQVVDGLADQRIFVSLNGEPAVKVSVQKQPDANTVSVVEGVKAKLDYWRSSGFFPEDVTLTATLDESKFIRNAIHNVVMAGVSGSLLAALAVFLFLGSLRQTLIIVLAIPLASFMAIVLMGVFGLSINIFSLGGLALGVGIVVDNSIVMLESIAQAFEQRRFHNLAQDPTQPLAPDNPLDLAATSSRRLESALLASTTTNLVSVVPFLLVGGFFSLLFNELILTISFSVAASLLVALTVVPMLTSRLLTVSWSSGVENWFLLRQFRWRLQGLTRRYGQSLAWVLTHRLGVILSVVLVLGSTSIWMVDQIPQEILPNINTGQAQLRVQFPSGTSLETNQQVMAAIDQLLLQEPDVAYGFTTAGGGLFGANSSENLLQGSSTITLKPGVDAAVFAEAFAPKLNRFNLVDTRIRVSPESVRGVNVNNSIVRADVDLMLQSPDPMALEVAGEQVLAALDEQATLAQYRPDGDRPQPEFQIRPDWERSAQWGLTTQEIGNTIQTALQGSVPTQLQRGDRLVDVRVQLQPQHIQTLDELLQLPLFTRDDRLVRLNDVAQGKMGIAPGQIQRINQRQVFIIAGTLNEGVNLGDAIAEAQAIIGNLTLPDRVSLMESASAQTNREVQQTLVLLGSLASFLVFVVMAVQYNSLIDPLVILLTVPLALAGAIVGLFISGTAIGATVIVGAILLIGIVVNNAIIMVERANQIRQDSGLDHAQAILAAAPERLRPILMTTITTVLGLFPLALGMGEGSEFLQPLGIVVFSGLSLATFLTLFIIPCFYTLLHDPRGQRPLTVPRRWGQRNTFSHPTTPTPNRNDGD